MTMLLMQDAETAIGAIETATQAVIAAVRAEHAAIRARDEHKDALVASLVGNANPLTGKPHSATSAAEAAERDETYRVLDAARREAEYTRIAASAAQEQAKLRAQLAVRVVGETV